MRKYSQKPQKLPWMYFHSHLIIYLQPLNMETAFLYRFHIIQKSRFTKKALETLIHAFILKLCFLSCP